MGLYRVLHLSTLEPLLPVVLMLFALLFDARSHIFKLLKLAPHDFDKCLVLCVSVLDLVKLLPDWSWSLEQDRLDRSIVLLHDVFVFQLTLDFSHALHVGVDDLRMLLAETLRDRFRPFEAVEFEIEVKNVQRVDHVDERETNRVPGLQIHRQVKVIVFTFEIAVDK